MKIKIKVTKDILYASRMCGDDAGFNCAIALAVREIFPNAWVETHKIKTSLTEDGLRLTPIDRGSIDLPEEATRFIRAFDERKPEERILMTPIEFEVTVPNEVINEIDISNMYKVLSESKSLELVSI